MNLKISLFRFGTLVFGQVIEQSGVLVREEVIKSINGFKIISNAYPELSINALHIRGSERPKDNQVFSYNCADRGQADELIIRIKEAVDAVNVDMNKDTCKVEAIM